MSKARKLRDRVPTCEHGEQPAAEEKWTCFCPESRMCDAMHTFEVGRDNCASVASGMPPVLVAQNSTCDCLVLLFAQMGSGGITLSGDPRQSQSQTCRQTLCAMSLHYCNWTTVFVGKVNRCNCLVRPRPLISDVPNELEYSTENCISTHARMAAKLDILSSHPGPG
jgi:hypothetical protein